jgi:phenylpropionate dioxygenase-like ring-hydroxylating dioxygenase large terminal subunit
MTSSFMRMAPGVPDLGNDPLPVKPYLCPDFFAGERENIFGKVWLNVARGCEIPNAGDFIVRPVEIRNASVIVVRGEDGVIRAFHNVCSHRSAKVEWRACGNTKLFSCPYHAWSYDTHGKLRGVPSEGNFPGLDKAAYGLTPIHCDTWNDLVFINFDETPDQTLREYLGELVDYGDAYPMSDFDAWVSVDVGVVNCNWKIFLDAFQEIYHLNALHRQTLTDTFKWADNPQGEPAYFSTFGPHRTISMGYNPEQRSGPMATLAQRFASDITSTGGSALADARSSIDNHHTGVNPGRIDNWAIDVTTIFPNVVWLVGSNSAVFHKIWPIDREHTRYENFSFYRKPKTASERFSREVSFGLFRDTIVEDILNTEFSQQALLAGAKKNFLLQTTEVSVRHHHHHVGRYVRGEVTHG